MTIAKLLTLVAACAITLGVGVLFLWNRTALRSRRNVERRWRNEVAGLPPDPRDYRYAIEFDAKGFTVIDLQSPAASRWEIPWTEVSRGVAFKRDQGTVDCICLFVARRDGTGVELDEEMAGWPSLIDALPQFLPGCAGWSHWFHPVSFPPFATCETEIFVRQD